MAYGHPSVITQLHKIQMPFCIPTPTTIIALRALSYEYDTHRTASRAALISAREKLMQDIDTLRASDIGLGPFLGGSQANFIVFALLKRGEDGSLTRDNAYAKDVTQRLMKEHSISVRFIGELYGCEAAVRVTVGREWENRMFCEALRKVMGC
jgi:histidinol-phosphate aminotransferase